MTSIDQLSELFKSIHFINTTNLLPHNNEWFNDLNIVINTSHHLINVYRPIGINTINTTMNHRSYDIRGPVPNPKHAVSPWSNSSIEPDNNIMNL